jgi:cation:H+ antiporter
MLLINSALLLGALIALAISSHVVIGSSIKIARITRMGELIIGFVLLAVATSIPELAVSISAVVTGEIGISIGNLLGSNVADLALIIGFAALLSPILIRRKMLRELSTTLFFTSMILLLLLQLGYASRLIGLGLLLIFVYFIWWTVKRRVTVLPQRRKRFDFLAFLPAIFWFSIGLAGVIVSSAFVVSSASSIAALLGIASSVIGATAIAIGTSLPELAVNITAIRKRRYGLAIGNTIGSCLTNLSLVLGAVLVASPFVIDMSIFSTLIAFVLLTNIMVWFFMGRGRLARFEGSALLFVYLIFIMTVYGVQLVIL